MSDDGITVTNVSCPPHTCALMLSLSQSDCTSCIPAGCAMCNLIRGAERGAANCPLPDTICKNRPCPRFG